MRAVQGPVLMVMRGPGNPEFGSTQERALGLLEKLNIEDARAPVIFHTALTIGPEVTSTRRSNGLICWTNWPSEAVAMKLLIWPG